MAFTPALIVVDMQRDFCPPDGSLAVTGGRDIIPAINQLLALPTFAIKVGTKDYHPQTHVSFASNHPPPNNQPFNSFIAIPNHIGGRPDETMQQRLWPDHCVQGTPGAEFVDSLDADRFDLVVTKGMDERVEMYSAFTDSFGNMTAGTGGVNHDLADVLQQKGVTHAYVVGLAGDYCVAETAKGAANAGFVSFLIEDAQRCVSQEDWEACKPALAEANVKVVTMDAEEVKRLMES